MIEAGIFVPNPGYGLGTTFRRIRLTRDGNQVLAELEDIVHGMRCTLRHDDARAVALESEIIRVPMNNCLAAGEALQALAGLPIDSDVATAYRVGQARANCTHLFDIAWLAVTHIGRRAVVRQYDIAVDDERDGIVRAELRQDGQPVLAWTLRQHVIEPPADLAGQHLFKGFTHRVTADLPPEAAEWALVLQKGCFIAEARRWLVDISSPLPIHDPGRLGVCYSYAPERIAQARRLDGRHPAFFATTPDDLLKFLP